jgi:DNA modification methylase
VFAAASLTESFTEIARVFEQRHPRARVELQFAGSQRLVVQLVTLERIEPPPPPPNPDAPLVASPDAPTDGWVNQLFRGDNQLVLAALRSSDLRRRIERAGGIKLIYVDPPFDVGQDFHMDVEIGEPAPSERPSRVRLPAYRDTWGTGKDSFLAMLWERLLLMHELLADDGSIYVHCDWRVSAQIRLVLDEIFGRDHFSNEIVWHYYNKLQGNVGRFASNHDVILSYRKGPRFHFEPLREKRDEPKRQQKRAWDSETRSLKQARDEHGNLLYYEETERTIDDVWRLPYLMPANQREPLGYPTQKPEQLVERIVRS